MNEDTSHFSLEETSEGGTDRSGKPTGSRMLREGFDWLETLAYAFCFVILVFTFLFRIVTVEGSSMKPTLIGEDKYTGQMGDRLIISGLFYTPEQGDIVVVKREGDDPIIKRVIATEGQTVDIDFENWIVTVDGEVLEEPYINRVDAPMLQRDVEFPLTVSEGHLFVMGDNRNNSLDSRDSRIGEVSLDKVVGRVLLRVFPFNNMGPVKPTEETVAAYEKAVASRSAAAAEETQPQPLGDNEFSFQN